MGLTFRFYRTPVIGTGVRGDGFRSPISDIVHIDPQTGQGWWDWIHNARPIRYGLAYCDSSVHATIAHDSTIVALSPELADLSAVVAWLKAPISGDSAALAQFETDGISTGWTSAPTPRFDMWKYAAVLMASQEELKRAKNSDSLDIFSRPLTATVAQIPLASRQKVGDWIVSKGLDKNWITGTTTIRQVLQYLFNSIQWVPPALGPISFNGDSNGL